MADFKIERRDEIGVCLVTVNGWASSVVWIRDDMELDVQCDLMLADVVYEVVKLDDDREPMLAAIHDELRRIRPSTAL